MCTEYEGKNGDMDETYFSPDARGATSSWTPGMRMSPCGVTRRDMR